MLLVEDKVNLPDTTAEDDKTTVTDFNGKAICFPHHLIFTCLPVLFSLSDSSKWFLLSSCGKFKLHLCLIRYWITWVVVLRTSRATV